MLKIFLYWRITLLIITFLGSLTFPLISNSGIGAIGPGKQFDLLASWAQWDGGHYINIANNGYQDLSDFAFFPIYPAMIRFLSVIFNGNLILSSLIISNFSAVIFIIYFYKLLKEKYSQSIAFASMVTYLTYPFSFYLVASYSESLFLLLLTALIALIFKKKYFLAAALVIPISLTRGIGFFASVILIYAYLYKQVIVFQKFKFNLLIILTPFLGITGYLGYLKIIHNNEFLFLTAQSNWQRSIQDPLSTVFAYLWSIITLQPRPFNDYIDLILTIGFLLILILGRKKIPSSWWIFSTLAILIPASTGTLTSMPRYLLGSFGVYVIVGKYFANNPKLAKIFWTISLVLQVVFSVMFINGYWVA